MADMTMIERIRAVRLDKGMTQEELAVAAGFSSRSTINKIELGKRRVTLEGAKKIASALGVDADWLIFGDVDGMKEEINRLFDLLPPEKQEAVLQFLRSMLGGRAQA